MQIRLIGKSADMADRGVHRINVNFSEQDYQTLDLLAHDAGKSMSEVLREAINLKAWVEQTRKRGGQLLVEHPGGTIREVVSL